MPFLKKLGQILTTGLKIVAQAQGLLPFIPNLPGQVGAIVGEVKSELELMASSVVQVEMMGNALALPGAQKLTALEPQITQVFLNSRLMAHRKVKDEAKFKAAMRGLASNLVDALNSLDEDGIDTVNKA